MSIDAKIVGITWLPTGEARLALEQEDLSRVAGQETLIVTPPLPRSLKRLLQHDIWGGESSIMLGDVEIGKRIECVGVLLYENNIDLAIKLIMEKGKT